jgi:hypothetical protein
MKEQDHYYLKHEEPTRGALLAMRDLILMHNENISANWKYGMPFFCYKGKMFCYLWVHKKLKLPYLGIVEGLSVNDPDLIQEGRSRMKILLINPSIDLPINKIKTLLNNVLDLYQSRILPIK